MQCCADCQYCIQEQTPYTSGMDVNVDVHVVYKCCKDIPIRKVEASYSCDEFIRVDIPCRFTHGCTYKGLEV